MPLGVLHLHGPRVHGADVHARVAEEPGQGGPPELLQLTLGERARLPAVLIPVAVAELEVAEGARDDAVKRGADQRPRRPPLRDARRPQVHVVRVPAPSQSIQTD